ncbi:exodeoxyribonuclease III [Gordonia sp. (in: high G+C Gram-positive bacteria)]|uniref:exodeoxyribonuclease III n=1 Tax=Gordonia sp. (in: high G+C Gram-positive bacteria) TaxID=84139 RepID=UPI001696581B|nr:exodeoxyribonuclease III [Gordonia sp. (in: high G+C Gram-positive bacteria)]NLG46673.1 exodeoxyribonuclease III [Gordonia sp. (in: high G+C Gram-positive bacteria)]
MTTSPFSISSVNVNGIRAAVKHRSKENLGMLPWLEQTAPDIVLMQEVRATDTLARKALQPALDAGWHLAHAESTVKGRAGVGILSRREPSAVRIGFGSDEFDDSGRYIEADFDVAGQTVTAASLYLPTGAALTENEKDVEKYHEKVRFLDAFRPYLDKLLAGDGQVVVAGDWNIARDERDIKNWKGNVKNAGFLPHEREWVAGLVEAGWVDIAREHHGDVAGPYAWWSWRGKAFDNDAGWRIDYHLATPALAQRVTKTWVDRADAYNLRWSDHAPVNAQFA